MTVQRSVMGYLGSLMLLLLVGCIGVEPIDEGPAIGEPVLLLPGSVFVKDKELDSVLVEADQTVPTGDFDTGIVRRVAAEVRPAVVSVFTSTRTPHRVQLFPIRLPGTSFTVRLKGKSLGSGFFVHPEGYILTNNHVIRDAEAIRILTHDGKDYGVTVIARDPTYDLALLRVDGSDRNFPVLPMGDVSRMRVGDFVIAVGNPLGLGHTVTFGIISQTDRNLAGLAAENQRHIRFLQTDAAINPGSSGGPLISLAGAWVGVNTAAYVGAQNLGFSVPADQVKECLEDVLAGEGEAAER